MLTKALPLRRASLALSYFTVSGLFLPCGLATENCAGQFAFDLSARMYHTVDVHDMLRCDSDWFIVHVAITDMPPV